jgi:excisionase family DNA binding protein
MIAMSFRLVRSPTRSSLITHRDAARRLQVSARTVRLWVETGAWPLPRYTRRTDWLFEVSDVEDWAKTGGWPRGARYRFRGNRR